MFIKFLKEPTIQGSIGRAQNYYNYYPGDNFALCKWHGLDHPLNYNLGTNRALHCWIYDGQPIPEGTAYKRPIVWEVEPLGRKEDDDDKVYARVCASEGLRLIRPITVERDPNHRYGLRPVSDYVR